MVEVVLFAESGTINFKTCDVTRFKVKKECAIVYFKDGSFCHVDKENFLEKTKDVVW